jgi:hypothetical protein
MRDNLLLPMFNQVNQKMKKRMKRRKKRRSQ